MKVAIVLYLAVPSQRPVKSSAWVGGLPPEDLPFSIKLMVFDVINGLVGVLRAQSKQRRMEQDKSYRCQRPSLIDWVDSRSIDENRKVAHNWRSEVPVMRWQRCKADLFR